MKGIVALGQDPGYGHRFLIQLSLSLSLSGVDGWADETCDMSPRSLAFSSEPLAALVLRAFTCAFSSSIWSRYCDGRTAQGNEGGRVCVWLGIWTGWAQIFGATT